MDEWDGLRTAAIIAVWVTLAGGALMALVWAARGGFRAIGPEDDITGGDSVAHLQHKSRKVTSFSSSHVVVHGLLGILTAILVTYGALLDDDDRTGGYIAILVALGITIIPGIRMFQRWKSHARPAVAPAGAAADPDDRRVEDRLPSPVVYLHGLAALATIGIVVALLVLD